MLCNLRLFFKARESFYLLKEVTVASLSIAHPLGPQSLPQPECRELDLCMNPKLAALLAACMTLTSYLTSLSHYFLICKMD